MLEITVKHHTGQKAVVFSPRVAAWFTKRNGTSTNAAETINKTHRPIGHSCQNVISAMGDNLAASYASLKMRHVTLVYGPLTDRYTKATCHVVLLQGSQNAAMEVCFDTNTLDIQ